MAERPVDAPPLRLSPLQQAAVDFARSDLAAARAEDLATMDDARLILLAERLRGRLGTILDLLSELASGGDATA